MADDMAILYIFESSSRTRSLVKRPQVVSEDVFFPRQAV